MSQWPPIRRLLAGALILVIVAVGAVISGTMPAGAHSFLVSTSPFQGQRLDSAPQALVLEFSEAVDLRSVELELQTADGRLERQLEAELSSGGLAVRAPVGILEDGVHVVAWQVLSAVDGHGSSGEFAFSVGAGAGTVPASTQSEPIGRSSVIVSWLFTVGLGAFLGAAVLRASGADDGQLVRRVGRPGLVAALAGAGVAAVASRTGLFALSVVAELLLLALVVVGFRRGWVWSSVAVVVAAAVWATRSHGANDGWLGWALDFVHLVAGSAWLGSLLLMVLVGWRARGQDHSWLPAVRRYAWPALWLVLVLGGAGTAGAVRLIPTWTQLWSTTYGRVVVAKVVLFAIAAMAAMVARWRGLHRRRPTLARRVMTAEAGLVVGAAALAGVLAAGAPPLPAVAADQRLGPPPLGVDVARDAGLAGQLNVEVTSNGRRLDISVFGPSGPLAGTQIDVSVTTPGGEDADLLPRPCGAGCFTQALDLESGSTSIAVTANAPDFTGGRFEGALDWPAGVTPLAEVPQGCSSKFLTLVALEL